MGWYEDDCAFAATPGNHFLPRGRHTIRNISRRPSRKALDFELKLILLICLLRIKRLISAVQDAEELLGKREKI